MKEDSPVSVNVSVDSEGFVGVYITGSIGLTFNINESKNIIILLISTLLVIWTDLRQKISNSRIPK